MRTIAPPVVAPADLLTACINGVKDPAKTSTLNAAVPTMLATAAAYHAWATAKNLHMIPRVATVGGATKEDMKGLYEGQMSNAKGSARAYYDLIKSAAPNGKCPLCGVGIVRTLDHHLPKSSYPDLSVCPYNLVPACDFCQSGKLAKYPVNASEQTFHPYYDDFTTQQWIFATLNASGTPALQYQVKAPSAWQTVDKQRALRHFTVFKLDLVYTSNANDDLITLRGQLERLDKAGGAAAVQAHLDDERDRWMIRLNSWQHVMYQTLAANAWFVNGGYLEIPT